MLNLKEIAFQCLAGLKFLHDQNIAHLDIKPENFAIQINGKAVKITLIDYGMAKPFSVLNQEQMSYFVGTARYHSPEIKMKQPYDESTDMWSCGHTFFLLLGGVHPVVTNGKISYSRCFKIDQKTYTNFDLKENPRAEINRNFIQKLLCAKENRLDVNEALGDPFFN